MAKKSVKTTKVEKVNSKEIGKEKRLLNLEKGKFKPGQSGNPKGMAKGTKTYKTLMREAMISLAKKNGTDPKDLELEIFEMGLKKARLGDYRFYQDYMDRHHDKPVQKNINLDIEIDDEEIDQKATEAVRRFMGLAPGTGKQGQKED
jgi:hypothetical protein